MVKELAKNIPPDTCSSYPSWPLGWSLYFSRLSAACQTQALHSKVARCHDLASQEKPTQTIDNRPPESSHSAAILASNVRPSISNVGQ